jgi:antitoxin HicB
MSGKKSTIEFKIDIVVEPDDVGFHAYCPSLKGLHAAGDTEDEALQNAKEAAIAYLESLIKHNDPIPISVIEIKEPDDSTVYAKNRISYYKEDLQVACAT